MEENSGSKMPPPTHAKIAVTPATPYVPPIVPGEPKTKFVPKKLLILMLFVTCLCVIAFAFWLGRQ